MSAYQPPNKNFLSPFGFRMSMKRTPNTEYFVQSVSIPGVNLAFGTQLTPFTPISHPTSMSYGDLTVTFKVAEDLTNYLEIFNWITDIGAAVNFDGAKALANKSYGEADYGFKSDVTVSILNSAMKPNVRYKFYDAFPIDLSEMTMDATLSDVDYVTATVTFRFLRPEIVVV